jgi:hypothetical protein
MGAEWELSHVSLCHPEVAWKLRDPQHGWDVWSSSTLSYRGGADYPPPIKALPGSCFHPGEICQWVMCLTHSVVASLVLEERR